MQHKAMSSRDLAIYLDGYLNPHKIDENSINGLQVDNTGPVRKIATAVSASLEAIERAAALNASVLIVHHGIFCKNDLQPLSGAKYRKVAALIKNNIALLCYHLPLDAHRELGNNWKAAHDLGLTNVQPFLEYNRQLIGAIGVPSEHSFDLFKARVETYYGQAALAAVKIKDTIDKVAIVSGGAERFLADAAHVGADCFVTGRVDEPVFDTAHEEGISFLGLGHYATETVGPKALALHLQERFAITSEFIQTENPF